LAHDEVPLTAPLALTSMWWGSRAHYGKLI
jgi:hypothetical protein